MSQTCILTDEFAQFIDLDFHGQDLVQLMPVEVRLNGRPAGANTELRPVNLPHARSMTSAPELVAPSVEAYRQVYLNLSARYRSIVAVCASSGLIGCYASALKAAKEVQGKVRVEVVDTGAIGVGQGILAAAAAVRSAAGEDAVQIKKHLLGLTDRVYAVFCIRNMAYLERLGLINSAQATVGEMLDVQQLFYLNAGTLVPVQKIRNSRHMVESILEFVSEFVDPERVALLQAASGYQQEARTVRERLLLEYPEVQIQEIALSLPMAALLGPQSFGLFLWEVET